MSRRASGEGTICQRRDGRWEAAVWVTTPTGERRRKRVYASTREECHAKYVGLLDRARRHVPMVTSSPRLTDYLDYWLEYIARPSVRATTYAKYESFVRLDLKPGLGRRRLEALTPQDVRVFLARRQAAGDSKAQLHAMHAILRNALEHAVREDLISRNVARLVRAPRPSHQSPPPWTVRHAVAFLSAAKGDRLYAPS